MDYIESNENGIESSFLPFVSYVFRSSYMERTALCYNLSNGWNFERMRLISARNPRTTCSG